MEDCRFSVPSGKAHNLHFNFDRINIQSCRLHSRVEIETRTGFFQRFNSLHESSSLHLGLPSSSRCGASIYVLSTVALCLTYLSLLPAAPLSLFSPLRHLFILFSLL